MNYKSKGGKPDRKPYNTPMASKYTKQSINEGKSSFSWIGFCRHATTKEENPRPRNRKIMPRNLKKIVLS
jgi:hypothetical protein